MKIITLDLIIEFSLRLIIRAFFTEIDNKGFSTEIDNKASPLRLIIRAFNSLGFCKRAWIG
jgi:hypothetical protein